MSEDEIALQPVTEKDIAIIEELIETPAGGEFAWFGHRQPGDYRKRWAENGLLEPDRGAFMVVRGGDRLGFVTWSRKQPMLETRYWVMGIGLVPSARGKGYGTIAQRLLVDYLFAHSPAHRIEADTELENIGEQRSLEKVGFTREGVIRAAVWRDGKWRDGVIYGILRDDPRPSP
ncbi:MAG TPA: GNAT family protein [Pseudonocardiaceae bacterium]|nr:GNAT family protein [Pseudonocardiaceae bacterium]